MSRDHRVCVCARMNIASSGGKIQGWTRWITAIRVHRLLEKMPRDLPFEARDPDETLWLAQIWTLPPHGIGYAARTLQLRVDAERANQEYGCNSARQPDRSTSFVPERVNLPAAEQRNVPARCRQTALLFRKRIAVSGHRKGVTAHRQRK